MSKIVGVRINTRSPHTKDKVYYYTTNKDFKKGDRVDIKVPSGGTPTATIVIQDSKKKFGRKLKDIES